MVKACLGSSIVKKAKFGWDFNLSKILKVWLVSCIVKNAKIGYGWGFSICKMPK